MIKKSWFTFQKTSYHFKTFDTGLQILQVSENSLEIIQVILGFSVQLWYNIVTIMCFKRNNSYGLYDDLMYNLRIVKGAANFILSGSKIVKVLQE